MYKGTHWAQFPSLYIYVEKLVSKFQFEFLMSGLSAPKLVTFELTTEASVQMQWYYIEELRSPGPQWPVIFKAPKVLKLSGVSSWEIEFFLRRMQLDAVQEISLHNYGVLSSMDVNLAPPIMMPALEMLSIGSQDPISRGSIMLLDLEAPAPNSLTLSQPFIIGVVSTVRVSAAS
jgi:hypothetical protein